MRSNIDLTNYRDAVIALECIGLYDKKPGLFKRPGSRL